MTASSITLDAIETFHLVVDVSVGVRVSPDFKCMDAFGGLDDFQSPMLASMWLIELGEDYWKGPGGNIAGRGGGSCGGHSKSEIDNRHVVCESINSYSMVQRARQ